MFTIFYGPLLVLEAYIVFCVRSCRRALFPTSPLFAPVWLTGGKEISSLPVPEGALVLLREEASTVEPTHEPAILSRQRALYAQLAVSPLHPAAHVGRRHVSSVRERPLAGEPRHLIHVAPPSHTCSPTISYI